MKILISSIACNPYGGSENLLGWHSSRALADLGEIWLLVSAEYRVYLERAQGEGLVPAHMHFVYIGESRRYHENRLFARIQSWLRYMKFSRAILPVARELHAKIGFDLVHHVTYSTWRVGSPLWRLGIPFVWGPISGTEVFPLARFGGILSPSAKAFEFARIMGGVYSRLTPEVGLCARNAFHIFAAHREAVPFLSRLRGKSEGISVFSYFNFSPGTVAAFARPSFPVREGTPLKILAGGNLEGRKGVALALQGLAIAKKRGVKFSYRITGRGSEEKHLGALAKEFGIGEEVIIGKEYSREDYAGALRDADLYLLPSLREGGGLTMMEAMLAGCVPIVADCGGPGTAVTPECGVRIPVTTPRAMAEAIADAVERFDKNRPLIAAMGAAAAKRIATAYAADGFLKVMRAVYDAAVPARRAQTASP